MPSERAPDIPATDLTGGKARVAIIDGGRLSTIAAGELAALIGPNTARYALIRRANNPAAPVDLAMWRRADATNPFYAVCLQHARLVALARYAGALAFTVDTGGGDAACSSARARLRRIVEEFPAVLDHAARRGQPHRITRALEHLARATDAAWGDPLDGAWLTLADQTRQTLAGGMTKLGLTAPDRW